MVHFLLVLPFLLMDIVLVEKFTDLEGIITRRWTVDLNSKQWEYTRTLLRPNGQEVRVKNKGKLRDVEASFILKSMELNHFKLRSVGVPSYPEGQSYRLMIGDRNTYLYGLPPRSPGTLVWNNIMQGRKKNKDFDAYEGFASIAHYIQTFTKD